MFMGGASASLLYHALRHPNGYAHALSNSCFLQAQMLTVPTATVPTQPTPQTPTPHIQLAPKAQPHMLPVAATATIKAAPPSLSTPSHHRRPMPPPRPMPHRRPMPHPQPMSHPKPHPEAPTTALPPPAPARLSQPTRVPPLARWILSKPRPDWRWRVCSALLGRSCSKCRAPSSSSFRIFNRLFISLSR
jgi:hypothetical protein